jgi:hypothetical protein
MVRHAEPRPCGLLLDAGEDAGATLIKDRPIMEKLHGKEANRLLGRTGPFWQREYYDHLVRDEADFVRCIDYTINNSVKASLCERWEDWAASGLHPAAESGSSA